MGVRGWMQRHPVVSVIVALVVIGVMSEHSSPSSSTHTTHTATDTATDTATGAATHTAAPTAADGAGATVAAPTPKPTVQQAPRPTSSASAVQSGRSGTALAALAGLRVKGRSSMTGYDRNRFGQAWLDADRNGCDTRNDILRRDVKRLVFKPNTHGCVALSGVLPDPYSGANLPFQRGYGDLVDIDHVVPMGNAWVTGAAPWDIHKRAAFANDPLELLAVDSHLNRQKGDGDAATWLPPAKGFRCAYVARQVSVKKKYGLWVTPPEKAAITRILTACPGQPLTPDPTHAPTRVDQAITDPGATPGPQPTLPSKTPPKTQGPRAVMGGSAYYKNCTAVRAAGKAPIRRGDPGYDRHLDRDGDGIACE